MNNSNKGRFIKQTFLETALLYTSSKNASRFNDIQPYTWNVRCDLFIF